MNNKNNNKNKTKQKNTNDNFDSKKYNDVKKTHNQSRAVVMNMSNKVAVLNNELVKKNYNINIGAIPKLLELFGYILTHHEDSIGLSQEKDYYNIKIKKETMKKILFSDNTNYLWHDFQVDMINLAKQPIWRNVYLQSTDETVLLQPISIKEFRYKNQSLNNLEVREWDEIFIDYSVRFFSPSKSHFTIPTHYNSYIEHYTKTLKPLIISFASSQYSSDAIYGDSLNSAKSSKNNEKSQKRSIYISHDKVYSIINYLLDTDNKSENEEEALLSKRSIDLEELARRCYPYAIKTTKAGNKTLRYKELTAAIFQSLFVHNSILLHTGSVDNKYIRLTSDLMSLEINQKERKALIEIINLQDLKSSFNIRLCLFILQTQNLDLYTSTFKDENRLKLENEKAKIIELIKQNKLENKRVLARNESKNDAQNSSTIQNNAQNNGQNNAQNELKSSEKISYETLKEAYNSSAKIRQNLVKLAKYFLEFV